MEVDKQMQDIDKLMLILNTLNMEYADYYKPDGTVDVQICDLNYKVLGTVQFDADGKLIRVLDN